jgi:hypothetical protein
MAEDMAEPSPTTHVPARRARVLGGAAELGGLRLALATSPLGVGDVVLSTSEPHDGRDALKHSDVFDAGRQPLSCTLARVQLTCLLAGDHDALSARRRARLVPVTRR